MKCPICGKKLLNVDFIKEDGKVMNIWVHQPGICSLKDGIEISIVDNDTMELFQKTIGENTWLNKLKRKLSR